MNCSMPAYPALAPVGRMLKRSNRSPAASPSLVLLFSLSTLSLSLVTCLALCVTEAFVSIFFESPCGVLVTPDGLIQGVVIANCKRLASNYTNLSQINKIQFSDNISSKGNMTSVKTSADINLKRSSTRVMRRCYPAGLNDLTHPFPL